MVSPKNVLEQFRDGPGDREGDIHHDPNGPGHSRADKETVAGADGLGDDLGETGHYILSRAIGIRDVHSHHDQDSTDRYSLNTSA